MARRWARISCRPAGRLANGRLDLVFRVSCTLHGLDQHQEVLLVSIDLVVHLGYLRLSCAGATAGGGNVPELRVAPDIAVGKAIVLSLQPAIV